MDSLKAVVPGVNMIIPTDDSMKMKPCTAHSMIDMFKDKFKKKIQTDMTMKKYEIK